LYPVDFQECIEEKVAFSEKEGKKNIFDLVVLCIVPSKCLDSVSYE